MITSLFAVGSCCCSSSVMLIWRWGNPPQVIPNAHYLLVPAWSSVRYERQAATCSMVKSNTNAPEIHSHAVALLLGFPQNCTLVHVRVLHMRERTPR